MSTPHTSSESHALVIGAGSTGLAPGAHLLAGGISTHVIDNGPGPLRKSRAIGIHALELLDVLGLGQDFVNRGQQIGRFRAYTEGVNQFDLRPSVHPPVAELIRRCVGPFLGGQDA
jgi:2-polyprenyl-6-methoxyphenol hydroxylase-like FAD-dependent oxidoreductase